MLNTLRRSFGMSPSSSQTDMMGATGVPAGVLSPSNKPNTFVPLRRSNSFTNFFSSSRPSSPVKDTFEPPTSSAVHSATKQSSAAAHSDVQPDPVLAFLVLLDKKGRQKESFPIQNPKTTLGRSIENDVRFLASDVSRIHCTIEIEIQAAPNGNTAFLQVLGANGVLLNGVQALPAPRGQGKYQLNSGDSIVIAKRSFLFKLNDTTDLEAAKQSADPFASPVKGAKPSAAASHTPAGPRRRVRMSLVNAAQIDTPARASRKAASPTKSRNADDTDREERRANGLQRFMLSANVSPSKARKSGRQSLTSSTSSTGLFATPLKSRTTAAEPKTAPPKQVSFSLYANSYSGRLSPVKQMRMMPPLEAMSEEQDGSFRSDSEHVEEHPEEADSQHDESEEDIVIVEELEQEVEAAVTETQAELEADNATEDLSMSSIDAAEDAENIPPPGASIDNTPAGSPSKSGSPKRAKRRSSFFGRAGPFKGMSLGFYAEERTESSEPVEAVKLVESSQEPQSEEAAEHFSDASDVEPEEEPATVVASSPSARRVAFKHMRLGISKTPSPVKKQHFVGLTPLPRRPRLSLSTKRRVSLRTQTLLRSSEAYSDRLFLPPPPPSPAGPGASGLSKSMSMPSSLSGVVDLQQPEGLTASASLEDVSATEANEDDFESLLDPALVEETPAQAWRDSDEDEDEVDQSLSVSSLSPQKPPVYNFSPVKTSALPQFATPQPASKTHSRRISMPPAGASGAKPSARAALVRLQISGAGERIVHEKTRDTAVIASSSSPSKSRKVVRVSDVGLPATELSMGFDLVHDGAAEAESDKIAEALNDMFTAEQEELTDDEQDDEEEELTQEEVVQISSRNQSSPERPVAESAASLPAVPRTPAALNSMRHLFSAAAAAPGTPNMDGLASMLQPSPEKAPQYGVLGERMRAANPEISAILSPSKRSPTKAALAASPSKPRRSVRRSEAAEVLVPVATIAAPPTPLATPTTPRALPSMPELATPAVTPLPTPVAEMQPAFEAELHVTMFDAAAMDAQNEAIAQALSESEAVEADADFQAVQAEAELDESTADVAIEPESAPIVAAPVVDAQIEEEAAAASPEPTHEEETEAAAEEQEVPAPLEPSASKARASRRAASVSPTKPRALSVSPTKRATRSSPVKRAAPQAEAESAAEVAATAADVFGQPEEVVESEKDASESPSKAKRRTGTRKAKAAASQAIAEVLEVPAASPEKRTRRTKVSAAKSSEAEEDAKAADGDDREDEQDEQEEEEVMEAPKRATRARATRTAASTIAKPVRASRSRAAKASEAAHPSSSAAYGDDEASDDEAAPTTARGKRATTKKVASSPTKPAARSTRTRTTATRTTRAKAAATVEESDSSESSAENNEGSEQEAAPAPKTRTRAAASKPRAAKSAAATTASSRSKAKPKTDDEAATTRSGRPRRAAAAK